MSRAVRHVVSAKPLKLEQYEIIIPAAGQGSRMTCYGAKSLLHIDKYSEITILQHQLNLIQKNFTRNPQIILITGFQSNKVMNHAPNSCIKIENEHYDNTNVVRSIGMGLRVARTNRIVIIYGDLVFNKYALNFPIDDESCIIIDNYYMKKEEVGCIVVDGYVKNVWYDIPKKWAQIIYLTGRELELAKRYCWNMKYFNMFGFEMINYIIKRGGMFKAIQPYKIKSVDVDTVNDLMLAQKIL